MEGKDTIIRSYVSHLKCWIQDCNEHHGDKCQAEPIGDRPPHHIPDWVIDTDDDCIVRGCSVPRYVALSYVWNSSSATNGNFTGKATAGKRMKLHNNNLEDFCRHGFLRSGILKWVPVVIKDAIDFVKLSGYRYLWVDSLCIVQHEDTTWHSIGLMSEIYSGACFTIIAAASTEGLYGNQNHDIPYYPQGVPSAQSLHRKLLCSHWASRGWTFQEQLLSKRSMVFLDDICFWDCQCQVQWPNPTSGGIPEPLQVRKPPDTMRHPLERAVIRRVKQKISGRGEESQHLTSLSPVPDFNLYIELVCRYSNRNLTYDQDALPAFSGVLETFSRRSFCGGFVCGLPALFFDSALLWQPLLKARRRSVEGSAARSAQTAPLPSWSWAGWQCLLDPNSLESGLDYTIQFTKEFTSWRLENLVDWCTLSDDGKVDPMQEPALLQTFKTAWRAHKHRPLPTGWYRMVDEGFSHQSNPRICYRYPLPTQDTYSSNTDRNTSLLYGVTKTAFLRVRRVLVPHFIDKAEWKRRPKSRFIDTSVFRTGLYNFKPELKAFCPVVTLEDGKGRWAGTLPVMDDRTTVHPGTQLEMIAISTGSALHLDVAGVYAEKIDSTGRWCYSPELEEYRFRLLNPNDMQDNADGVGRLSAADDTRTSLSAGIDVGPFARAPASSSQHERYHFYNVLWVEKIDGIMYRKAAGRVPKEIWEQNCGKPTEIILG